MSPLERIGGGRRVALVVLVLGILVGAVLAWWLPRASERMATESAACTTCHADVGAHLEGHENVECQGCHAVPEDIRFSLATAEVRGDDDPPRHGAVSGSVCVDCHAADEAAFRRQLQTAGHRTHVGEGVSCTSCHASAMHGGPIEPNCAACHQDLTVHGDVGDGDCVTCHGFRVEDDPETPAPSLLSDALLAIAPWTARLGVDHVHGAGDCRTCHNPHESAEAQADCIECHRGVLAADVASGPEGHQACASCHEPHPPRDAPAVTCLECHRPPSPGQRRRTGDSLWASAVAGDAGAPPVDASTLTHDGRCGTCHTPHVFDADPQGCPVCHGEMETALATVRGHDACLQCHEPHSAPPGAESCRGCHRDVRHDGAPEAHRSCLTCHEAHHGAPELETTCARCHGEVRTALAGGPAPHEACASCHEPHGAPSRRSTASCASCHGAQARTVMSHASPPAHRACASCHAAHDFTTTPRCADCHEAEARASGTWPSGTVHAGPCAGCHTAHEAGRIPQCRSCHAEQSNRTHTGSHRDCASCHQVHEAFPSASTGWWGTCASCHEGEARAGRGAPGAHAACRNCHEPIGQRPPTCTSCHDTITQTLQHQVRQHQNCADCHADHSVAPPRRAVCVGCHEDQATGHFPDAGTCQSCHPFAR